MSCLKMSCKIHNDIIETVKNNDNKKLEDLLKTYPSRDHLPRPIFIHFMSEESLEILLRYYGPVCLNNADDILNRRYKDEMDNLFLKKYTGNIDNIVRLIIKNGGNPNEIMEYGTTFFIEVIKNHLFTRALSITKYSNVTFKDDACSIFTEFDESCIPLLSRCISKGMKLYTKGIIFKSKKVKRYINICMSNKYKSIINLMEIFPKDVLMKIWKFTKKI